MKFMSHLHGMHTLGMAALVTGYARPGTRLVGTALTAADWKSARDGEEHAPLMLVAWDPQRSATHPSTLLVCLKRLLHPPNCRLALISVAIAEGNDNRRVRLMWAALLALQSATGLADRRVGSLV